PDERTGVFFGYFMARDFGIEIEKINQKIETANSIISKIDEITSKNTEFCRKLSLISKYLRNVEINGGPYDNGEFDSVANGLLKYESSFSTLKSALKRPARYAGFLCVSGM
ncbi:MAG: hypothetical protein II739_00755, partial [Clostridia bacterium]|nr:hypothetical protein [Clostridia bacterium]